jgi:two-component system chemotaxis response regulator CheB
MSGERPVRVLLVDDSPFVCKLMANWIGSSPGMDVVATAQDGYQGISMIEWLKPDVVTLDLEMPMINGLETLHHIMGQCPTPVVVVSGVSRGAATAVENAFSLGAVDFIFKYQPGSDANPDVFRSEICAKIKAASQVHVRRFQGNGIAKERTELHPRSGNGSLNEQPHQADQVVVLGASTGGVDALQRLLEVLPRESPGGILVVQSPNCPKDRRYLCVKLRTAT